MSGYQRHEQPAALTLQYVEIPSSTISLLSADDLLPSHYYVTLSTSSFRLNLNLTPFHTAHKRHMELLGCCCCCCFFGPKHSMLFIQAKHCSSRTINTLQSVSHRLRTRAVLLHLHTTKTSPAPCAALHPQATHYVRGQPLQHRL